LTMGNGVFQLCKTRTGGTRGKRVEVITITHCQFLLTTRRAVCNAAYFTGESARFRIPARAIRPAGSYDSICDQCRWLHTGATSGMSYHVCVAARVTAVWLLPTADANMTPSSAECLGKTGACRRNGRWVPRPAQHRRASSIFPACDSSRQKLENPKSGPCDGKFTRGDTLTARAASSGRALFGYFCGRKTSETGW